MSRPPSPAGQLGHVRVEDEPRGLITASGLFQWGVRVVPEIALTSMRGWLNPSDARTRLAGRSRTMDVFDEALAPLSGGSVAHALRPGSFRRTIRHLVFGTKLRAARGIPYGPEVGQVLEIWRRPAVDVALAAAPVLVFVPGGGWVHGRSAGQGQALLGRLAARGWVCVAINYRVAPAHRWPAHIEDVSAALSWVRQNVSAYGGSSEFIAVAGASAGGHLATLAGLTTSKVDAVVSLYGRYDWESRGTRERRRFMDFLERVVVGAAQSEAAEIFAAASPVAQVRQDAPPFFVIHGSHDAIIPVPQARHFVDELSLVSSSPVVYAELPGAGHAFDLVDPYRAMVMARAVEQFLDSTRRLKRQRSRPSA